jgi:hypothetical protein
MQILHQAAELCRRVQGFPLGPPSVPLFDPPKIPSEACADHTISSLMVQEAAGRDAVGLRLRGSRSDPPDPSLATRSGAKIMLDSSYSARSPGCAL